MPTSCLITPNSKTVNENARAVTFTVTRSGTLEAQTVYASTVENGGSPETSREVTIYINDNNSVEGDETFGLIVHSREVIQSQVSSSPPPSLSTMMIIGQSRAFRLPAMGRKAVSTTEMAASTGRHP